MHNEYLQQLDALLSTPDAADLYGYTRKVDYVEQHRRRWAETVADQVCARGSHVTCIGAPDRQKTVFLPLIVRWAQHHYMSRTMYD